MPGNESKRLADCLARYLAMAKQAAGNPSMTDSDLAQALGSTRQPIYDARRGRAMSLPRALLLGRFLHKHGLVEHPVDVLLSVVASQAEPEVATAMRDFARRVQANRDELRAPKRAA